MSQPRLLRIATRGSPLALWQAEHVAARMRHLHHGLEVELVAMKTTGDKLLDAPLAKVGGKGLFVKELENALLDDRADIAVHSMKDVPVELPAGLHLPVLMAREDPRDALVSSAHSSLAAMPAGARVGTSSLRRKCQIAALRPDLELLDLRGNVNTRLGKLDAGDFDAIVLACAGLRRLGMQERIAAAIEPQTMLPAIGQGVMGIECRVEDPAVEALIAPLHDDASAILVGAERALNARIGGGCQVPLAGHAVLGDSRVWLAALVASVDGTRVLRADDEAPATPAAAETLGRSVAERLLGDGAGAILEEVYGAA
jgi:hydroxymethylbilane synthase